MKFISIKNIVQYIKNIINTGGEIIKNLSKINWCENKISHLFITSTGFNLLCIFDYIKLKQIDVAEVLIICLVSSKRIGELQVIIDYFNFKGKINFISSDLLLDKKNTKLKLLIRYFQIIRGYKKLIQGYRVENIYSSFLTKEIKDCDIRKIFSIIASNRESKFFDVSDGSWCLSRYNGQVRKTYSNSANFLLKILCYINGGWFFNRLKSVKIISPFYTTNPDIELRFDHVRRPLVRVTENKKNYISKVIFFGQPLSELSILSLTDEYAQIITCMNKLNVTTADYFPHSYEDKDKLETFKKNGLNILDRNNNPAELFMLECCGKYNVAATYNSTVVVFLKLVDPTMTLVSYGETNLITDYVDYSFL